MLNIINKKTILLILIILLTTANISAQIQRNSIFEKTLIENKYNYDINYITHASDLLITDILEDTTSYFNIGIQADAFYQSSAIDPEWNYNDNLNYSVVPYIFGRFSAEISYFVSFMAQNAKTEIIDRRKEYLGESQIGHWGDFEIAKIQYESKHLFIKYGRDYFMPGIYYYEGLLFSQYQYPYDQLYLAYRNNIFELSSYYLRLNDMHDDGERYLRHLNGHRLSINLFNRGYLALNEVILYTGIQRPINPALFNPLLVYYLYQRNENIESTNSMFSIDAYYTIGKLYTHMEFILDDIMTERQTYSDLEPTKYGLNITLGIKDILPGLQWNINHTRLANRVYSTFSPRIEVERFIHENIPIGHYMGSNLYEIKSSLYYSHGKYSGELQFIYRKSGDDVLYSLYNTDHFQGHEYNDPLEPGAVWHETIPYVSDGTGPDIFWGFRMNQYYQLLDYLGINIKASYWVKKGLLNSNFNIAGGLYLNL